MVKLFIESPKVFFKQRFQFFYILIINGGEEINDFSFGIKKSSHKSIFKEIV